MISQYGMMIPELWLYGIFFVLAIGIIVGFTRQKYFWSGAVLVLALFLSTFTTINVVALALSNPLLLAEIVGGYLILGLAGASAGWLFRTLNRRYEYSEARKSALPKFLALQQAQVYDVSMNRAFHQYMLDNYRATPKGTRDIDISYGRMVADTLLWPFNLVGWVFSDAVTWLVRLFLKMFGGVFVRINHLIFRGFPELHD